MEGVYSAEKNYMGKGIAVIKVMYITHGLCLSSTLACLLIFCRNAVLTATFVQLWLFALFVQCLEKYSLHMFYITSLSGDEMVLYIWRWGERNKDLVYFYLVGLHTAKGWVKKQQNYTVKLLVRCCATMCC